MIRHISSPDHIVLLSSTTLEDSIKEILDRLIPDVRPEQRWFLRESIVRRERLRHTVLPSGVAFPRSEAKCVKKIICGVGISEIGIRFGNNGEAPIQTMFVSLYPEGSFSKFVPVLDSLVRFSQDPEKMASLRRLPRYHEEFRVIREEVFPWGLRELVHSHVLLPLSTFRSRMGTMARVDHD